MFPRKWVKSRNHYCVNSPERTNPGKLHAFEKCDPTEGLPVAGRLYPGEAGTKQEIVYFDAEEPHAEKGKKHESTRVLRILVAKELKLTQPTGISLTHAAASEGNVRARYRSALALLRHSKKTALAKPLLLNLRI